MIDHVFFFVTCGLCRVAEWVCTHYMQQKRKRLFGDAENLNEKIIFPISFHILGLYLRGGGGGMCTLISVCVQGNIFISRRFIFVCLDVCVGIYFCTCRYICVCVDIELYANRYIDADQFQFCSDFFYISTCTGAASFFSQYMLCLFLSLIC